MTWWCKARQLHLLLWTLMGCFLLSLLTRGTVVSLPGFLNPSGAQVSLPMFFSVLPAVVLITCLESGAVAPEITGVRRTELLDLGLSTATVASAILLGFAVTWWTGDPEASAGGRNTAFLVGLALTARFFTGKSAVLFPVLWPVCVALFGFHGRSRPYHWTILPEATTTWYAAVGAALAFIVGIAAQFRARRTA